jgi:hypothetical protein
MKLGLGAAALGTAGVAALYISDRFNQVDEERQKDRAAADKERAATEKNRADAEKERERHATEREQERANAAEREREREREREQERTAADERERARQQERAAAAARQHERDAADSERECELKSELERRFAEFRDSQQPQQPKTTFQNKWLRFRPQYDLVYADPTDTDVSNAIRLVVSTYKFTPLLDTRVEDCTHQYITRQSCRFHLPNSDSSGNNNCTPRTGIDSTWFNTKWGGRKSKPLVVILTFGSCRRWAFECGERLTDFVKKFNKDAKVKALYTPRDDKSEDLLIVIDT